MSLFDFLMTANESMTHFDIMDFTDKTIIFDELYNIDIKLEYKNINVQAWQIDYDHSKGIQIIRVYTDYTTITTNGIPTTQE